MRNFARLLAFDFAVPLATIAGLLAIGVMLDWPLWWVSACSVLCLLVVQGIIANAVLFRRDSVTLGTDDDAPALRLLSVGVATLALAAAAVVGYNEWTLPDRAFTRDSGEVVRIASTVSEATASFTPDEPTAALDRAVALMEPARAEAFTSQFATATADLAKRKVTASAQTIAAGLEALGSSAASVAVLMRGTQSIPGQQPETAVLSVRVALSKLDGVWKVSDVTPINSR